VEKVIGQILVDKQVYSFAQTFFGYCITGENDEKVFFIASGVGNNGKSLFFSQFEHLLGDRIYYSSCSKEIFLNSKFDKSTCPELFQLKGMRFAICSETDEHKELKESTIKAITGNDSISGRDLYKSSETVRLYCKLGLITNHLPIIKSNSEAIWSRIIPIEFNSSFQEIYEDLDEKDQYLQRKFPKDKNLSKRIETEEYKSKFLRWLVEGSVKYYNQGLHIPDAVKLSKQTYHSDSDVLQDFIDENIERCPGMNSQVGFRDLYILFCKYCKDVKRLSEIPISDRKFKSKMEEKGIQSLKNSGTVFKDIKILNNL
jgi:putative DNA primase/helicase